MVAREAEQYACRIEAATVHDGLSWRWNRDDLQEVNELPSLSGVPFRHGVGAFLSAGDPFEHFHHVCLDDEC